MVYSELCGWCPCCAWSTLEDRWYLWAIFLPWEDSWPWGVGEELRLNLKAATLLGMCLPCWPS